VRAGGRCKAITQPILSALRCTTGEKAENNNGNSELIPKDCSTSTLREKTVLVDADGSLKTKGSPAPQNRDSKMLEIIEKLGLPDFRAVEVHRLIAVETALVTRAMGEDKDNSDAATVLKEGAARVKALRALANAVEKVDSLTKRDELNFDGPKFKFVFDELLQYFEDAAKEALGKNCGDLVLRIMKTFRDVIAMKEAELRRRTAKIGTPGAD